MHCDHHILWQLLCCVLSRVPVVQSVASAQHQMGGTLQRLCRGSASILKWECHQCFAQLSFESRCLRLPGRRPCRTLRVNELQVLKQGPRGGGADLLMLSWLMLRCGLCCSTPGKHNQMLITITHAHLPSLSLLRCRCSTRGRASCQSSPTRSSRPRALWTAPSTTLGSLRPGGAGVAPGEQCRL